MQKDVDLDLGKWLLCRLLVKQGYSGTDVAKHMEKNEALACAHPNLDENIIQSMHAVRPAPLEFSRNL